MHDSLQDSLRDSFFYAGLKLKCTMEMSYMPGTHDRSEPSVTTVNNEKEIDRRTFASIPLRTYQNLV